MPGTFQIEEHMEVVGSDGQHVGEVDRVEGDRLKLTREDSNAGGVHHYLNLTTVAGVEDDRVVLNCSAAEARGQWQA
jgi:hypothetical protein